MSPPVPCSNLAYDIQRLYDKDPLGNVLVDKKKLEKTLLLSYVCNTKAGELRVEPQPGLASSFLDPGPAPTGFSSPAPSPAEYQRGFHEMVMLFQLMVGHEHETFWLFQFFLQKTVRTRPSSNLLLPTAQQTKAPPASVTSPGPQTSVGQGVGSGSIRIQKDYSESHSHQPCGGTLCWPLTPYTQISLQISCGFPGLQSKTQWSLSGLQGCLFVPTSPCFLHMTHSPDTLEDSAVSRVYPTLHPG